MRKQGDLTPVEPIILPGIELPTKVRKKEKPPGRDYKAERQRGAIRFVDRVVSIAENADQIAAGRTDTEWILIAKALADSPLPYRPTDERQITKRSRFDGAWVSITYTCARPIFPCRLAPTLASCTG